MKRHKWEDISNPNFIEKVHRCVNCGVERVWWYGDYQRWKYYWSKSIITNSGNNGLSKHNSFKSPECIPSPPARQ